MRPAIILTALIASSCAQPALARSLSDRIEALPASEYAWQGLNAADKGLTIDCLNRGICHEANPVLGHHPSTGALVGLGIGEGLIHAAATMYLQDHAPKLVPWFEGVTIAVAGTAVGIGLKFPFRGRK
jgi:hypothetical protein